MSYAATSVSVSLPGPSFVYFRRRRELDKAGPLKKESKFQLMISTDPEHFAHSFHSFLVRSSKLMRLKGCRVESWSKIATDHPELSLDQSSKFLKDPGICEITASWGEASVQEMWVGEKNASGTDRRVEWIATNKFHALSEGVEDCLFWPDRAICH